MSLSEHVQMRLGTAKEMDAERALEPMDAPVQLNVTRLSLAVCVVRVPEGIRPTTQASPLFKAVYILCVRSKQLLLVLEGLEKGMRERRFCGCDQLMQRVHESKERRGL